MFMGEKNEEPGTLVLAWPRVLPALGTGQRIAGSHAETGLDCVYAAVSVSLLS